MIWRIDVYSKDFAPSLAISQGIKELGIKRDVAVYAKKVYFIDAHLSQKDIHSISSKLLIDPVSEDYSLNEGFFPGKPYPAEIVITYNPGVCDPVALSLERALSDLSMNVKGVRTGRYYKFDGLDDSDIAYVSRKILYNPLIEHILDYNKACCIESLDEFINAQYSFKLNEINIMNASSDELIDVSRKGNLSLTLREMEIIRDYFSKKGRNPTDCELETIAQTWSEHCAHKTFRGIIDYKEINGDDNVVKSEKIVNLLKSTIVEATHKINSDGCVSVFDDNSGVVRFNDSYNLCFKVETHNHPSALEPYGGASTGIGGVIRDVLGTGTGAKPVANIDVFCFSPWDMPHGNIPQGLLHPKRIIKGVVRGVRDYGNKMGIPTVAGAVVFDSRFLGNPLVYCGTVGLMPKDKSFKQVRDNQAIVVCGALTGRDGIHGATFSSVELSEDTVELTSAVQIGNPIEEKKLLEAIIRARDKDLISAITDCGAGGLSSAVGELAKDYGAQVFLDKVPLKYKGLSYTEIWISESQERMVIFTENDNLAGLKEIFDEEEVQFAVIGKVTASKRLELFYGDNKVADLDMDFMHDIPCLKKDAVWIQKESRQYRLKEKKDYTQNLKSMLGSLNISPKDWIVREYDHEVQAQSVIKPIFGIERIGISDASVFRPDLNSKKCVALGIGINPFYSDIDPYWMAALAIDEALRNVICVGAKLDKTYLLDNFSWGAPTDKNILGELVRAAKACYDFSLYFGTPFISGKDSLYNEYTVDKTRISIPGTLLISAVSVVDDYANVISSSFKKDGNLIYILGPTASHMGASEYFRSMDIKDKGIIPKVDMSFAKKTFYTVSEAVKKSYVVSCHDCSEGGLAVALSEMCLNSGRGASVFLGEVPVKGKLLNYEILFSESPSRFIVEVEKDKKNEFENICSDISFGLMGCVAPDKRFIIYGLEGDMVINSSLDGLYVAWIRAFEDFR